MVDVRIRRADLPEQNSQAVYQRMQTERQREAAEFRANGSQRKQEIQARADRDVTVLLADAQAKGDTIRGEGEAERNRIFAEAFGKDPDFFAFYRSMQAYESGLRHNDTRMVLRAGFATSSAISPIRPASCAKTARHPRRLRRAAVGAPRIVRGAQPGRRMADFIVALGLVFVIEGLIFAVSPGRRRTPWRMCWKPPDGPLRLVGIASAVLGVVLVWLVRGIDPACYSPCEGLLRTGSVMRPSARRRAPRSCVATVSSAILRPMSCPTLVEKR